MPNVNRVIIIGHLTRDPQLKFLPNQTAVAEFGIATSRKFKAGDGEQREETTFVDCACFGRQAEVIEKFCKKGKPLYIEGRLKYDTWEDKNGGGKRSKLSVIVENFQFLGGRDDGESAPPPQRQQSRGPGSRPGRAPVESPIGDEPAFDPDSIPF